jgi:phosphate transport system substrate-binding protein
MKVPPIVIIAGVIVTGVVGFKLFTGKAQTTDKAIAPPSDAEVTQITNQKIKVRVDGSTSMVTLNKAIKDEFPNSPIALQANGTDKGIQALLGGKADIAASSRDLKPEEQSQGLVATKVGDDAIAFVVGVNNAATDVPFETLKAVFAGKDNKFQVINRPKESATREMVTKALALSTLAGKTLPRDNTTQMLGMLGDKGIGYATYSQVKDQSTVKVLLVDGASPSEENYSPLLRRSLYYVTKGQPQGDAEAFIKVAASIAQ